MSDFAPTKTPGCSFASVMAESRGRYSTPPAYVPIRRPRRGHCQPELTKTRVAIALFSGGLPPRCKGKRLRALGIASKATHLVLLVGDTLLHPAGFGPRGSEDPYHSQKGASDTRGTRPVESPATVVGNMHKPYLFSLNA